MKSSSKSPTVAELKQKLSKMGVVHKSSDSKATLKGRLTKAKNAKKKSPKKSPKKRCASGSRRSRSSGRCRKTSSSPKKRSKRASPKKRSKKRSGAKRGPKAPCREGYSRNSASGGRCAEDGSNKLKTVTEIKAELKERYHDKYGSYPKLGSKSKSQAISMLARINKCPESGKVWDSVSQTCKDAKLRGEIGSKAVKKLEKLAIQAQKDLVKHELMIKKIGMNIEFSKQKAEIAKAEKAALADLDAKAEEAEKEIMEALESRIKDEEGM